MSPVTNQSLQNECIFRQRGVVTKLTPAEKAFLILNSNLIGIIKADADKASLESLYRFPKGQNGGPGDAYRHCYWSALLTRDIGERKALEFTNAHENWCGNPPKDKKMDLHNNAIGIEIGKSQAKNIPDLILAMLCKKALEKGLLKIISP